MAKPGRPRKNEEKGTPWVVRDVPEDTRRKVRVYAAEHDLTMAQAVEMLINKALPGYAIQPVTQAIAQQRLQPAEPVAEAVSETWIVDPDMLLDITQEEKDFLSSEEGQPLLEIFIKGGRSPELAAQAIIRTRRDVAATNRARALAVEQSAEMEELAAAVDFMFSRTEGVFDHAEYRRREREVMKIVERMSTDPLVRQKLVQNALGYSTEHHTPQKLDRPIQ